MQTARSALLTVLMLLIVISPAVAQVDEVEEIESLDEVTDITGAWYLNEDRFPVAERAINIAAGRALRPGSMMVIFDHRVRESISEDPFHDLLGFDAGGLKIGFGFRYGLRDRLDLGFYRLNGTVENFDTYEFDARLQVLNQSAHNFDMALRGGVSWFAHKDDDDAAALFGQLLVSTNPTPRLRLGSGFLFHAESSSDRKSEIDEAESYALPAFLEFRLSPSLTWSAETVTNLGGYGEANVVISTAIKLITHRHTFAIILTNSQYTTADGIVANSGTDFSDAAVGFTVLRELGL